jgi:type I restriction enzyme, R subunit
MKFNEQYTVENYIIKFLEKELSFKYIKPKEFSKLREFESEYLIKEHVFESIMFLNGIAELEAEDVWREVKKVDTNEGFLNLMRNGVDLMDSNTRKTVNYKIVDFKNINDNKFVVTNQFYFEGDAENIRPDIMIFLNGLPIVDIEAKSPTASLNVNYEKAIGQIKRYEKNARKMFLTNCFNIATDGLNTVYGTTYAPQQYFLRWKDETLQKKYSEELEMTLSALLRKDRLLDIIENFILFEQEKQGKVKKICRYQQYRATNKIVDRVKTGKTKKGLIWHTQGSGKSLTMFFTAWKLRFSPELENPKIFLLVDRIDLDDQIYDTFINCGGKNIVRITSRKELEKKIKSNERGIFISTIQKFSELGDVSKTIDKNVIVLSDEAHRDNEGVSAINLRDSMKNAFFFGFTGTPIDKKTLNTHRNFGEEGERYLDYYSIQEAIDDGTTLPVTYEARLSKFFIDEEQLDKQFEELTTDLSEEQKEILSKKYGRKEAVVKLQTRMQAVARDIVEHYKLYVEPNGFKAQIVCYDRESTAKYKELLDGIVPAEYSEVVYSPGDPNSDTDDLIKYNKNKQEREKVISKFKDPESPLKFLLVCDMLLTGFDAPIEQVIYLDKPLRDHNLLQAIARTNRVYLNKGCGKIIDYYGITRNLQNALDFDENIVDIAMLNIDLMKDKFKQVLLETMSLFVNINIEDPSMDNLRRCIKIFIDNEDKQQYFSDKYSKMKLLFEILSPDPFLKQFLREFEWITRFYLVFVREFRTDEIDTHELADYGEKVKELIQDKIDYEGITKNFRELKINEIYTFERLNKMDDEEKAMNLEKILKQEISINVDSHPAYKKFSERLSAIKKEFEQNQIDLQERIKKYYELVNKIKEKQGEAEELGMSLKEYGLYVISEEFVDNFKDVVVKEFIKTLTEELDETLDKNWQESTKREEFLKEIKRVIQFLVLKGFKGKLKVNNFDKYLNRLVDIIIKKF